MAQNGILQSSLAKKYAMAATGLFLCLFLVGHLAGNLQLFTAASDGGRQFNEYAKFMTTFPAVKVLSYLTYFSVLFHLVDGIVLSLQNRKARPVRYAMERASTNAGWSSRNMMLLGTIVLVFLVTHMQNFWWQMHFGEAGDQTRRPTPTGEIVNVLGSGFDHESPVVVKVRDGLGRVVVERRVVPSEGPQGWTFDVRSWSAGIYTVEGTQGHKHGSARFVVTH